MLTEEGEKYAEQGSPEVQLFLAVPAEGSILKEELQVVVIDCSYIFFFCLCLLFFSVIFEFWLLDFLNAETGGSCSFQNRMFSGCKE